MQKLLWILVDICCMAAIVAAVAITFISHM